MKLHPLVSWGAGCALLVFAFDWKWWDHAPFVLILILLWSIITFHISGSKENESLGRFLSKIEDWKKARKADKNPPPSS